jgi:signal transduction histidine kinase/HAMP domain-containing protein
MRRFGLATLLVAIHLVLLLLAVGAVAVGGVRLLDRLGEEQARARVELAGASAAQAVERAGRDAATAARLLAERPTLRRLLAARDDVALDAFLAQFARTAGLDGAAVVTGQRTSTAGPALLPGRDETLLWRAVAPVPGVEAAAVAVTQRVDDRLAARIARQVGLPVLFLTRKTAAAGLESPGDDLRLQALASEAPVSGRRRSGPYLALQPLRGPGGEVLALVETRLPAAALDTSLHAFVDRLLRIALAAAAAGALLSFAAGRWLGRPVRDLTAAAAAMGQGDLGTPVPPGGGGEIGTLAGAMEEMRRRLLDTTAELRRRQAETGAVLGGIVEGVYSVDRDRRVRYLNPQAAELLGVTPEEAIGRFCGDLLNPQGPDGVRPCETSCPIVHARSRGSSRATEHLLIPGGRRTVVLTSAPPTEGRQVQVLRDETDVEASRRQRDAVLANISHEFKTPLAAQLASIELLRDSLAAGDEAGSRQLVTALARGTLRLTRLVDNLLESVRIEAGQDALRLRPVAVDQVVEEAVELTAPLLEQRGQRIAVDLPFPPPRVEGDAARLVQVFVNLLANANKFAPAESTVRIGGEARDGTVTLWVEDEGPGVPAPDEGSIFDRFYRAAGGEPEQTGLGLGLWIVKSIVERHGGQVAAASGGREGAGARLCVTLRRAADD